MKKWLNGIVISALVFFLSTITLQTFAQDNEKLVDLYRNRNWIELDQACMKLLAVKPMDPATTLIYGRALADRNRNDSALYYLRYTLSHSESSWMKAWAYSYTGVCYFRGDQKELAKAYLDSAITLNATANATKFALSAQLQLGLVEAFSSWQTVTANTIRFHFQDSVPIEDKEAFIKRRVNAYDQLQKFFHAELSKPIDFYVWKSRESAQATIFSNIGFSRAEDAVIHSLYNQTPGHELTHVLLQHGLKPEYKTKLINEGIAVRFDLTQRNYLEEARAAVKKRDKALSIKLFWENDKLAGEELFYPVGGAWVDFLKSKVSEEEFRLILQDQRMDHAQTLLKGRLDSLMSEFDAAVNAR